MFGSSIPARRHQWLSSTTTALMSCWSRAGVHEIRQEPRALHPLGRGEHEQGIAACDGIECGGLVVASLEASGMERRDTIDANGCQSLRLIVDE